jgi:hypothetical protein
LDWISDPFLSAARFNAVIEKLRTGVIPPERIYHMLYKDLIRDPLGTIELLYRHFGLTLTDIGRADMAKYLADNPRDGRPAHKLGMSAEAIATAQKAYMTYQEYFRVPGES